MARTYVEEIEDPITGQLQVFEAATETELARLVASAFPQDEADHPPRRRSRPTAGRRPRALSIDRH
jgi:hypothetical protein